MNGRPGRRSAASGAPTYRLATDRGPGPTVGTFSRESPMTLRVTTSNGNARRKCRGGARPARDAGSEPGRRERRPYRLWRGGWRGQGRHFRRRLQHPRGVGVLGGGAKRCQSPLGAGVTDGLGELADDHDALGEYEGPQELLREEFAVLLQGRSDLGPVERAFVGEVPHA